MAVVINNLTAPKGAKKRKRNMKQKIILAAFLIAALAMDVTQATAQNSKSNGTIEIIALFVPDSVMFKPAAGVKIKFGDLNVSLVSGTESVEARNYHLSGTFGIKMNMDETEYIFNDGTLLNAVNFNPPADFKPKKIKFEVAGKKMFYDIALSEWDK